MDTNLMARPKPLNLSQGKVNPLFERSISQMVHPLENDFSTRPLKNKRME